MPSINMIAPRRAEKQRLERDMRRLVLVIMAELILAVVLGGWVCTKAFNMRAEIRGLDEQIAKLQPVVKEIEQYESATTKLKPKLDLLGNAKDSTMRWYNSLDRLTQSLASSTYLTKISTSAAQDNKDESTVINLSGVSSAQARVGETMLRLQTIPDFDKVDLHYTQKTSGKESTGIEFEIGAAMKGSDSSKEVKSDGANQS
ncbi:MAG: PilN domain-containing protein [Armatimonadota bacterium]|nr:PilN domain-containing protein [bacterium]